MVSQLLGTYEEQASISVQGRQPWKLGCDNLVQTPPELQPKEGYHPPDGLIWQIINATVGSGASLQDLSYEGPGYSQACPPLSYLRHEGCHIPAMDCSKKCMGYLNA